MEHFIFRDDLLLGADVGDRVVEGLRVNQDARVGVVPELPDGIGNRTNGALIAPAREHDELVLFRLVLKSPAKVPVDVRIYFVEPTDFPGEVE
jgi:hypothetical protein